MKLTAQLTKWSYQSLLFPETVIPEETPLCPDSLGSEFDLFEIETSQIYKTLTHGAGSDMARSDMARNHSNTSTKSADSGYSTGSSAWSSSDGTHGRPTLTSTFGIPTLLPAPSEGESVTDLMIMHPPSPAKHIREPIRKACVGVPKPMARKAFPPDLELKTHAISVKMASEPGIKIPPEEWEKHKQEILEIFGRGRPDGMPVRYVRELMIEKHGFEATYV